MSSYGAGPLSDALASWNYFLDNIKLSDIVNALVFLLQITKLQAAIKYGEEDLPAAKVWYSFCIFKKYI